MGYNSTIVVLNDALHSIQNDKEFGNKVSSAILKLSVKEGPIDISCGGFVSAASVIETHHNSAFVPILVGSNCGYVIEKGIFGADDNSQLELQLLKRLADNLGYRLVQKTIR